MHEYAERIREFAGVLELAPEEGSPFPEIAWGDHFFYYAPDGRVPEHEQPFATCVTKDYPDDALSRLGAAGRWRLNIRVGRTRFVALTGEDPRPSDDDADATKQWDFAAADTVIPHPLYRAQGWVAVVNPNRSSMEYIAQLLAGAHSDARQRWDRRY